MNVDDHIWFQERQEDQEAEATGCHHDSYYEGSLESVLYSLLGMEAALFERYMQR